MSQQIWRNGSVMRADIGPILDHCSIFAWMFRNIIDQSVISNIRSL